MSCKGLRRKLSWPNCTRCLWIDVEGLRVFTNNFSRDNLCFGLDSNRTFPDYKSQALRRHQLRWSGISYGLRTVKHGSDQGSQFLYSRSSRLWRTCRPRSCLCRCCPGRHLPSTFPRVVAVAAMCDSTNAIMSQWRLRSEPTAVWRFARNILGACLYVILMKSHFIFSLGRSIMTTAYRVIIEYVNSLGDLDSSLYVEVLATPLLWQVLCEFCFFQANFAFMINILSISLFHLTNLLVLFRIQAVVV
jgi:hypothetical protein